MKKFFTLACIAVSFSFYGQIGFSKQTLVNQSTGLSAPLSVAAADFDGDGKTDVVAGGDAKLLWYKNLDGQGKFSPGKIIANLGNVQKIVAADIDGDNDKDIIFGRYGTSCEIYLAINQGSAGLAEPVQLLNNMPGTTVLFQVADIDGDSYQDIAFYNQTNIRWMKNINGQGSFQVMPASLYGAVKNFIFTDVTGDAQQDLIVLSGTSLSALKANGDATFTLLGLINQNATGNSMVAMDIDNDGDNDLVRLGHGGNNRGISYYKNDGTGMFANGLNLVPSVIMTWQTDPDIFLLTADIDVDGKQDIVCITPEADRIAWYRNLGNYTFGAQQVVTLATDNILSAAIADIDNNGSPDIISASPNDHTVAWYKNANGIFAPEKSIGNNAIDVNYVASGDIDGDGDKDLVSSSGTDDKIAWYKNLGPDMPMEQIVVSNAFDHAENARLFDMDNDGDLDIVAESWYVNVNYEQRSLHWFKNDGQGNFTQLPLITNLNNLGNEHYADIDNDGDIDVVLHRQNLLHIHLNNGTGNIIAQPLQNMGTDNASEIVLGDLNGDGKKDVLFLKSGPPGVCKWFEGNGQNLVGPVHNLSLAPGSKCVIEDLDGDGDNDIVYYKVVPSEIGWFSNDGSGNFGAAITIPTTAYKPIALRVYDVDGDGDKDIISTSETGLKLAWYQNDGQQNFSVPIEISSTTGIANTIGVTDINADGKADIFTSSTEDDTVNWFKNLGPFKFMISGNVHVDIDANGCTPADEVLPNLLVTTQGDGHYLSTFTRADGLYTLYTDIGSYTTKVSSPLPLFDATPQSHQTVFSASGNSTATADFCVHSTGNTKDLEVIIYPITAVRPGFPTRYEVVVANTGALAVTGGVLTFTYNAAKLNFHHSSPSTTAPVANMLTFNLGTMMPLQSKTFKIFFNAKSLPDIIIGEQLVFTAEVPLSEDITPANNLAALKVEVVGSYDPNDIAVLEGSQILLEDADEYLHYLIRFQNTGNYYAERVVVKNPIDSDFDWSTMQIESMSHNGRTEIINGAEATFTFDAIYLPAVTVNEPASHGYIAYKIKPKANVQLGDTFTEQAHIYFDFNPAIDTNIVTTTVVDNAAGLPQFTAETVSAHPVPSKNILNVTANSIIAKIEIYNQAGQRVLTNASQSSIDISALSQGVYFAKIQDVNGSTVTKKVVKN